MALAFNTALTGYVGSATSKTLTIAPSATADLLLAFVMTTNSSRTISSITWAGGADFSSTKIGPATTGTFKQYAAYKVAPTTGSNNLVFTIDSAGEIYCAGLFYDGAKQTSLFDASTLNTSTIVQTVTTSTSNCWAVCSALADGGSLAASTNSTTRSTILNTAWGVFDSNGTISTGGYTLTQTGSGSKGGVIVAIAPSVASLSSIKSADGVTQANIKSADGVIN
jgi:hypothetical protein